MTIGMMAAIGLGAILLIAFASSMVRSQRNRPAQTPPYIVALGAIADGDPDRAVAQFRDAVRADSSNVDAYLRLGDLFRSRGEPERAYHVHRELAARKGLPKAIRARVQEALCRDHLALGRAERAMEAGREAVNLADDPRSALTVLLEAAEAKGDFDDAFKVKKDLLKALGQGRVSQDELADYRAAQAQQLIERGELKEAERLLKEAQKLDSSSRNTRRALGVVRERSGDYSGAIESWQALLEEDAPEIEVLFRDLERVHFLNGSFSDIERTYTRFLESYPGHEHATFGLARFLRRKGQIDDALDACRRGLDTHPDSINLRVLYLALLLQSQRSGEAETVLNDWLAETAGGEGPALPRRPDESGGNSVVEAAR